MHLLKWNLLRFPIISQKCNPYLLYHFILHFVINFGKIEDSISYFIRIDLPIAIRKHKLAHAAN